MIAYGPADLPRLGWGLGIRNVPEGQCTYACLYCCLGGTDRRRTRRRPFHSAEEVVSAVRKRLEACGDVAPPDYLTFLHGGEPTLDSRLGAEIERLADTGVAVAIMTNGSLLWQPGLRSQLRAADRVLVKIDTVDPGTWRRLNRPPPQLRLHRVLGGIERFREEYRGRLDTATTLVPGVNDAPAQLAQLEAFLDELGVASAHRVVRRSGPGAADPEEAP